MKNLFKILAVLFMAIIMMGCNRDDDSPKEGEGGNAIVGTWRLKKIDDQDVSSVKCYKDSYIKSDGKQISFYLSELNQDQTCNILVNETVPLTIKDGFYYIGDEAIDFTISGNTLVWRPDGKLKLTYQK